MGGDCPSMRLPAGQRGPHAPVGLETQRDSEGSYPEALRERRAYHPTCASPPRRPVRRRARSPRQLCFRARAAVGACWKLANARRPFGRQARISWGRRLEAPITIACRPFRSSRAHRLRPLHPGGWGTRSATRVRHGRVLLSTHALAAKRISASNPLRSALRVRVVPARLWRWHRSLSNAVLLATARAAARLAWGISPRFGCWRCPATDAARQVHDPEYSSGRVGSWWTAVRDLPNAASASQSWSASSGVV